LRSLSSFWNFPRDAAVCYLLRTDFSRLLGEDQHRCAVCIAACSAEGSLSACLRRAGFAELILGQGPKPPMYGRVFSPTSSLRFYSQFQEYERNMELCNSEQSIQRPVSKLAQLLPNSIRRCLSCKYFNGDELDDEDLWEALSKHAECWEDDAAAPSIAAAEVSKLCPMGNERTATDR